MLISHSGKLAIPSFTNAHIILADILNLTEFEDIVHLAPWKFEILDVLGQQIDISGGIKRCFLKSKKPVWESPAVSTTIPFAIAIFSHLSGVSNIVGQKSVVLLGASDPSIGVFDYPIAILFLTSDQKSISY